MALEMHISSLKLNKNKTETCYDVMLVIREDQTQPPIYVQDKQN